MYISKGLSLFELLITLSIVSILVVAGVPAYLELNEERKVKGAIEASYFFVQQSRSVAVTKGTDVTVDFVAGSNWCIGISDSGSCSCSTANSCTVDSIEQVLDATDYSGVAMEQLSFGASDEAVFDGTRGISSGSSGSFVLSNNTIDAKLILSNMGRARICIDAGSLGNYPSC